MSDMNGKNENGTEKKNGELVEMEKLLDEFPADVRWMVKSVWARVPEERRQQLLGLVPVLPTSNGDGLSKLMELAQSQARMTFGRKNSVVIVGPTNVGKSTLYNQLIREKGNRARVSAVPGTTKVNQTADGGLFNIVDTPGADAVGVVGERERQMALEAAYDADFLIVMFDTVQGVKRTEQELFKELQRLEKPYLVVLNKMDLLSGRRQKKERARVIAQVAQNLLLREEKIVPISAEEGDNMGAVVLAILKAEPAMLAALGQALPVYRSRLAWQAIIRAASTSAGIALTPIPLVDFVPLVAVQGMLVLSIARVYNYKLTPKRAQELLGTMGMGYLGRTLFHQLSKVGGPPGWVISAAVAASTTVLVGYTAMVWFAKGEKVTRAMSRRLLKRLAARFLERFKLLGRKRPSRKSLADEVARVLGLVEEEQMLEKE